MWAAFLLFPLLSFAWAQATHTVQPGETLFRIAQRYGTTVEALQALNGLQDPRRLRVGQVLRIEGAVPALRRLEPAPPPLRALTWSRETPQGRLAVVRLEAPVEISGWVRFLGRDHPIQHNRALLPIPAMQPPGVYPAELELEGGRLRLELRVVAGSFGRLVLWLPPERRALLLPERLRAERERVIAACDHSRPQLWQGPFRRPVSSNRITDPFGTRRSYDQGRTFTYHEGLDYGVPEGTPVYAPAPGVVGLAERLPVRGGAVVLDHGSGVCSGFWHLSRIVVTPGQRVRAGDLLGYSGNTGLSSGPHLHFELRVGGVPTDPAPWFLSVP
ncbi:MAG: M23 family metallopeptidase [Meiothermus sp.]|uniref:LysM peptidoglycan-binding domain-containing M23 family metallopeptidase n=1 Tax=Meiothermus sp. TaxID=1955249 RepID=UPI00298EE1D1|nr:M23 family metallopeptidase [Meiothermus sp.]MCX7739648.1 M23 family metallopeptidase [Meiothermus sp.]MDW8481958.1 M23 family metallopeptidase [Meiothermus sp.]